MKLRFKGGHKEVVYQQDPKNPRKQVAVKKEQLTQMLEQKEYHWPCKGSVLTVPRPVGAWLLGKLGKFLEELEHIEDQPGGSPNRLVAVVPEEVKDDQKPEDDGEGEGDEDEPGAEPEKK